MGRSLGSFSEGRKKEKKEQHPKHRFLSEQRGGREMGGRSSELCAARSHERKMGECSIFIVPEREKKGRREGDNPLLALLTTGDRFYDRIPGRFSPSEDRKKGRIFLVITSNNVRKVIIFAS